MYPLAHIAEVKKNPIGKQCRMIQSGFVLFILYTGWIFYIFRSSKKSKFQAQGLNFMLWSDTDETCFYVMDQIHCCSKVKN